MSIWDTGYGSPAFLDGGFGSPDLEDSGYGSPFAFEFDAALVETPVTGTLYGEQGGYVIRVSAGGAVFTSSGAYRVDVVDDANGQISPSLLPGCHSGIMGQGSSIYAEAAGYELRFVLPRLTQGHTYSLRITSAEGAVLTVPAAVVGHWQAMCLEAEALRGALPDEVFTSKGAPPTIREV